jgi:hypothetical protein
MVRQRATGRRRYYDILARAEARANPDLTQIDDGVDRD